jgi:hypothetical protein
MTAKHYQPPILKSLSACLDFSHKKSPRAMTQDIFAGCSAIDRNEYIGGRTLQKRLHIGFRSLAMANEQIYNTNVALVATHD